MPGQMNYLSLFSGVGGLDLGLDRAGWRCVGQVEKDPFCQLVLAQHWPEAPRHDEVKTTLDWWGRAVRPRVDGVVGGPPCQPFSVLGERRGIADERWGWPWMFDVVRGLRPRFVLVENVAALVTDRRFADAFGWILADLASIGYDAEWDCIPASAVGAHHQRDRVFVVAYPVRGGWRGRAGIDEWLGAAGCGETVADADGPGLERPRVFRAAPERGGWPAEPDVGRVAHGLPARLAEPRIRGLGNAVVPQVSEYVGRLIRSAIDAGLSELGAAGESR